MRPGSYIRTDEIKKKNSDANLGKHHSSKTEFKDGQCSWNKGKHFSKESKLKMSQSHIGKYIGVNHPRWKGGKKLKWARARTKRRGVFGFIPLNVPMMNNWTGHHIDKDYVIYIHKELHKSIYHSVIENRNMDLINDEVYKWFVEYYFKEAYMI